jgi:stage IV sporulation protein FB
MLRFALFGIPIRVEWFFWITCVLLGGGLGANSPEEWIPVMIWTGVVFISILVHELGHAFAGRRFGVAPHIQLHGLGGVTILPGGHFTRRQSIQVSAAGPLAGLLLGILVWVISQSILPQNYHLRVAIFYALQVNFFWTFINLLPVLPLDGGQILRDILGPYRARLTSWIGFFCAAAVALFALSTGRIFLAILFGVFAYNNFNRSPVQGGVITQ